MRFRLLRSLLFSAAILVGFTASAQDIVHSLADFMPTWLNPALTGAYEGTARVGGLYRDQSRGFNQKAYQTPGFYVDAPIVFVGKSKKAWLGVGGTLISDTRGLAQLNSTYAEASASYHRIFNERKKSRSVISIGLQGGVLNRKADLMSDRILLAEEQELAIGGGGLNAGGGLDRQGNFTSNAIDIAFGVSLARTIDEDRNYRVGISARHLIVPDVALIVGDYKRQPTINLQAQYRQLLNKAYLIEPAVYVQSTTGKTTAQLQAMFGLLMGENQDQVVKFGLGFRAPQQVYPMIGYEFGSLRVAAAFDVSTGGAQGPIEGNGRNPDFPVNDKLFNSAFELAVSYIIKIYKQPKVEPVILCPQI